MTNLVKSYNSDAFGKGSKRKRKYSSEQVQSERIQLHLDEFSPLRGNLIKLADIHVVSHSIGIVYDRKDHPHRVALPCQHQAIKDEVKGWICRHECDEFKNLQRAIDSELDQVP